jgi:hypothetical protein
VKEKRIKYVLMVVTRGVRYNRLIEVKLMERPGSVVLSRMTSMGYRIGRWVKWQRVDETLSVATLCVGSWRGAKFVRRWMIRENGVEVSS